MEGRTQRELILEEETLMLLKDHPTYLTDFFYWMSGKAPSTKKKYIDYVLEFLHFCCDELSLEQVEEQDIEKINTSLLNKYVNVIFLKKKKNGSIGRNDTSIVNVKICAVSTFFRFLISQGVVSINICDNIERPRINEKDNITYLEQSEIEEVMSAVDSGVGSHNAITRQSKWKNRDKLLIALPLVTGMRISAMLDINIEDIDFSLNEITVTEKENKRRKFTVAGLMDLIYQWFDERQKLLDKYGGDSAALFITVYGGECKRMTSVSVNNIIKKYSKCTNKHITAHKLRASMATNVYDTTGDIYLVSELLGHKSPETTKKYARASEQKKQEALEHMTSIVRI